MSGEATIEALLREREGYLLYGRKDRAAQVDAELERLGYVAPKAEPKQVEEAGGGSARARSGRRGS